MKVLVIDMYLSNVKHPLLHAAHAFRLLSGTVSINICANKSVREKNIRLLILQTVAIYGGFCL